MQKGSVTKQQVSYLVSTLRQYLPWSTKGMISIAITLLGTITAIINWRNFLSNDSHKLTHRHQSRHQDFSQDLEGKRLSVERLSLTFTANGKRQTAKIKLLPSVFSSLYSRIKIWVFAVNSKRHFSIFVWFIFRITWKELKNRGNIRKFNPDVYGRRQTVDITTVFLFFLC